MIERVRPKLDKLIACVRENGEIPVKIHIGVFEERELYREFRRLGEASRGAPEYAEMTEYCGIPVEVLPQYSGLAVIGRRR